MDIKEVIHDNWEGEGWQAFQPLMDCPMLWRSGPHMQDWATRVEIMVARHGGFKHICRAVPVVCTECHALLTTGMHMHWEPVGQLAQDHQPGDIVLCDKCYVALGGKVEADSG
jgi:hypothetical protein